MFRSARLKLTAWYLLSIMAISILFSFAVYQGSTFEIRRGLRMQALHAGPGLYLWDRTTGPAESAPGFPFSKRFPAPPREFDEQLFAEAQTRVAFQLVGFNFGIFMLAGIAGYLLAGRTLKPIESMVDEQKRFVSDASHELRTPLTAMRTEAEVALRDKDFSADDAKEVLRSSLEEIGKLQLLSDHLLTLGRYEDVNRKLDLAQINLLDVVDEALQNVKSLVQARGIEIQTDVNGIALEADREGLVKLFIILLENAVKYSHPNGKIILRAHLLNNKAVITVQDFGAGIRAGDVPYIFNRFYRADASRTNANIEGYGLGLSIAKSIVEKHNGKINVESIPNEGTTFTISLPRKQ